MNKWTKDELRLALALYCQMPFGKMHRNRGLPVVTGVFQLLPGDRDH
jgi:hypothetical protein